MPCYLATVFIAAFLIRLAISFLRAFERQPTNKFWLHFWADFCSSRKAQPDYFHPAIVGALELFAYPVLLHVGRYEIVGVWVAFKTYSHRVEWADNRATYNRFMIGNAVVIMTAFGLSMSTEFFH